MQLPNISILHLNDNALAALPTPAWAAAALPPPHVRDDPAVNDQSFFASLHDLFSPCAVVSLRRNRMHGEIPPFLFSFPILSLDIGEV